MTQAPKEINETAAALLTAFLASAPMGAAGIAVVFTPAPALATGATDHYNRLYTTKRNRLIVDQLVNVLDSWVTTDDRNKTATFAQRLVNDYHCTGTESCPIASLKLEENGELNAQTAIEVLKILLKHDLVFKIKDTTLSILRLNMLGHPQEEAINKRIAYKYPIQLGIDLQDFLKATDPNGDGAEILENWKINMVYSLTRIRDVHKDLLAENEKATTKLSEREIFIKLLIIVGDKDSFHHIAEFLKNPDTTTAMQLDTAIKALKDRIEFVNKADEYNTERDKQLKAAPTSDEKDCHSNWQNRDRELQCA